MDHGCLAATRYLRAYLNNATTRVYGYPKVPFSGRLRGTYSIVVCSVDDSTSINEENTFTPSAMAHPHKSISITVIAGFPAEYLVA